MAVVIDNADTPGDAGCGEPPPDAAESRKTAADVVFTDSQFAGDRDGREGVQHVVVSCHGQVQAGPFQGGALMGPDDDVEPTAVRSHLDMLGPDLGLGIHAIGHQVPVLDPGDHGLDLRVIRADGCEAIEGNALDEFLEGPPDGVEGAVVIEVLGVDIGDDGAGGPQPQEGAIRLVGLHDHPVPLPHLGVGTIGIDDPAVDHGGIQAAGVQQGSDHGGGGGFPVGPADRHRELQAHELCQHLGAADQGQAAAAGLDQLGVIGLDRRRIDHGGGGPQIAGLLADEDAGTQLFKALGIGAGAGVRALHRIADPQHDLGDAAHADPADPDEVDGPDVEGRGPSAVHPRRPSAATASTRSARRSAASGRERLRAPSAIRTSLSG